LENSFLLNEFVVVVAESPGFQLISENTDLLNTECSLKVKTFTAYEDIAFLT
jgi:hypothetical protein